MTEQLDDQRPTPRVPYSVHRNRHYRDGTADPRCVWCRLDSRRYPVSYAEARAQRLADKHAA